MRTPRRARAELKFPRRARYTAGHIDRNTRAAERYARTRPQLVIGDILQIVGLRQEPGEFEQIRLVPRQLGRVLPGAPLHAIRWRSCNVTISLPPIDPAYRTWTSRRRKSKPSYLHSWTG